MRVRGTVRVAVSLAAAGGCVCAILRVTGLLSGRPIGAADNTDGIRLYRGAGLIPDTADRRSDWKNGVVVHFTRGAPSFDPIPSAALKILRAAVRGHPEHWSLTRLGGTYALLTGAVAGAAAWALSADGPARPLALLPILLPLADRDFARFFISTYSEPAGLLAVAALLSGTAILAANRPVQRVERVVGLALTGGGGLLAATTKNAYGPLLPLAAVVCAESGRIAGYAVASAILGAAVRPVVTAQRWQSRVYHGVNTHNLIFTMLLPELGPGATVAVGLPPEAAAYSGHGSSDAEGVPLDPDAIPGWRAVIGDDPGGARNAAYRYLARHPAALARAVGVAMQATQGRGIDYLRDDPLPAGADIPKKVTPTGSMGHDGDALRAWLDGLPAPWHPSLLAALGIAIGSASLVGRPRSGLVHVLIRVAGVSAVGAVGVAALAVVGDGYYEIAKHVWLSAYLLDVTAAALLGAAAAAVVSGAW
ncbi:hypothetical protein [Streptosporangium sp. NBC_01756]|uniref:hypothetical protein n=1 Tax=Streptosporangium sp. NBC_01756 TaxID=2975950 RepID=UPI002DD80F92|nr:hypothetical protein [Streptosporangium sp. NBC_01756]WSC90433.1 hypothetical protein OIE48_20345 [Streptosporangium sp. NBC_01756]